MVNQMNYRNWSLDQWGEMFNGIYGKQNEHRNKRELWCHVVEESGELAEALRKGRRKDVLIEVADLFAWGHAFLARYDISFDRMVWNKYPGVCPYCLSEENCRGEKHKPIRNREGELEKYRRRERPGNLYEWQEMFGRIYGKTNNGMETEKVGFHLWEEIAEVQGSLNKGTLADDEIADVFAWLAGLTNRLAYEMDENIRMDEIVWGRYPNTCPHCEARPCGCY